MGFILNPQIVNLHQRTMMNNKDTFFVGYLVLPKNTTYFLKIFLPILFLSIVMMGFLLARYQNAANKGEGWDPTGKTAISIKAFVLTKPYALAQFQYQSKTRTAILTSMTKSGVQKRLQGFNNQWLQLKGIMTKHNNHFVFSLLDDKNAITVLKTQANTAKVMFKKNKNIKTLEGEIIDPKCYVGAMKPGEGKTHKACATLCIKGGIPPVLLVKNFLFTEKFYLLLDKHGEPVLDIIVPFIGDLVKAKGSLEQWGDLWFFRLQDNSIKRLNK